MEPQINSHEGVVRQMITRENELTNQRMLWMAAINGLLFTALGFAWGKPDTRFLLCVFSGLGFFGSICNLFPLIFAGNAQRRILLWWRKNKPSDYSGPGVIGVEPLDRDRHLYSFYFAPWIWLAALFVIAWFLIFQFVWMH